MNMHTANHAIQHIKLESAGLSRLLQSWKEAYPDAGVLALLPETEKEHLPILQTCCREAGIALAGAIFPALLIDSGFQQEGVLLLRFDRRVPSFLIPDINDGTTPPAEKISQAILPRLGADAVQEGRPSLYMIFDAMLPNIGSILEELYLKLSDRVGYAGVNAGSETFQPMPCLFDHRQVIEGGVLCLLVSSRDITVLEHGYQLPKHVMTATTTEGNQIISIDWRPAFDVYQEIIKRDYGIDLTRDNFYQYAVHYPFGIPRANQDVVVRIPVALSDDGALFCVGEVPENAMLVLLKAPRVEEGQCVARLSKDLQTANGPLRGRGLLTFYCAGRRMHLGEDAVRELSALRRETGAAMLAGALSLGEIGSTGDWDYPMFHNATLVCTPWGSR